MENGPEKSQKQFEILQGLIATIKYTWHLSNPIIYIPNLTEWKVVLVIGNIRAGKSTLLNKLAYIHAKMNGLNNVAYTEHFKRSG